MRIERRRYATGNIRTRASKYTFVALSIAKKSRGNKNWLSYENFRRTEAKLSQTFHSRLGICFELSWLVFRPETVCLYFLPIKFYSATDIERKKNRTLKKKKLISMNRNLGKKRNSFG